MSDILNAYELLVPQVLRLLNSLKPDWSTGVPDDDGVYLVIRNGLVAKGSTTPQGAAVMTLSSREWMLDGEAIKDVTHWREIASFSYPEEAAEQEEKLFIFVVDWSLPKGASWVEGKGEHLKRGVRHSDGATIYTSAVEAVSEEAALALLFDGSDTEIAEYKIVSG